MSSSPSAIELRREPLACDPAALCRELGIDHPHQRQARGLIVCCPSHEEKKPSCSVRVADDGTIAARCHACGWSGDAIDLVMAVRGHTFPEALAELARMTGRYDLLDANANATRAPRPPQERRPALRVVPPVSDDRFHEIATWLIENCPIGESEEARAYLESRHILADAEAAGCAALPEARRQSSVVTEMRRLFGDDAEKCGLFRFGAFLFADNRLIIPWKDRAGRIATLQRRRLDAGDEHRYVFCAGRGPREPFGIDAFVEGVAAAPLVVSEGALDALARRKLARLDGDDAVIVAVPSASTPMLDVLAELATGRELYLSLDNDAAGDKAAVQIAEACNGIATKMVRERPQGAKDAGELLQRRLAP